MARPRTKIFFIKDKGAFFKTIRPVQKNKAEVSALCTYAAFWFKESVEEHLPEAELKVSIESTTIRQDFEDSPMSEVSFSDRTLNTFLCGFFRGNQIRIAPYSQDYTLDNIKEFFSQIEIHTPREQSRRDYNDFIDLVRPFICKELKGFDFKLDKNWKWGFLKNYSPDNSSWDITVKKDIRPFEEDEEKDELWMYINYLIDRYRIIRLNIIDFKIPVEDIIKMPLKERNEKKLKLLMELKAEIRTLESHLGKESVIRELADRVAALEHELQQSFNIETLLQRKEDIFVHAPAGYGKTTLLKWMTHDLASKYADGNSNLVPMYIELKSYISTSDHSSLKSLVSKSLKHISLERLMTLDLDLVLLIDGFDEFSGEVSQLLEEIKDLTVRAGAKIIFSGRTVPPYKNRDMQFKVFSIDQFTIEDISMVSESVLGRDLAKTIIDKLIQIDRTELLRTPLYLVLFLSYVAWINPKDLDMPLLRKLFLNKAAFFDKVLIEQFVYIYEKKRNNSPDHWNLDVFHLLEVLSYVGYYMTIDLRNKEIITRNQLENCITSHVKTFQTSPIDRSARSLVDSALYHNILEEGFEGIGFEKKDIRYFFAARYISKNIGSPSRIITLRNQVLIWNLDPVNTWIYLREYIFGLIDPIILIKGFDNYLYGEKFLLTGHSAWRLYFALELIDKKRYPPTPYGYINEGFLSRILQGLILDRASYEKRSSPNRANLFLHLCSLILRGSVGVMRFLGIRYSSRTIAWINNHYLSYHLEKPLSNFSELLEAMATFHLDLDFVDIQELLKKIDQEFYRQYLFEILLPSSYALSVRAKKVTMVYRPWRAASFSRLGRIRFVYDYILETPLSKLTVFGEASEEMLRFYVKETFQRDTNEVIAYYFLKNPEPKFRSLIRFYWFISRNGTDVFNIDSQRLSQPLRNRLLEVLLTAQTALKKNHTEFQTILNMVTEKFDAPFLESFVRRAMEIIEDPKEPFLRRIWAVRAIFQLDREEDVRTFSGLLRGNGTDTEIKEVIIKGLNITSLILKFYKNNHPIYNMLRLYNDFLSSDFPEPFLVNSILFHSSYSNDDLEAKVITLVDDKRYTEGVIDFLGRNRVEKGISHLKSLISDERLGKLVFHSLTLIDPSYYERELDRFRSLYELTNTILESLIGEEERIRDGKILENALHVGDGKTLELLRQLKRKRFRNRDLQGLYATCKSQLKRKVSLMEQYKKSSRKPGAGAK